jgi:glycosyltransferase involved in cell wall biosynthesis
MDLKSISVTVLTKNSQQYLLEVLQALAAFGEVLLYDTGSTDQTMTIAKDFSNVRILEAPFIGFGPTHNQASAAAKNDWILSIDSDEVVTPQMLKAITDLHENPDTVYAFPRNNYFNGKFIKWCGWYPDKQFRLYNRNKTRFSNAQVHESIITENLSVVTLNGPIVHYSYASISDFLSKMQTYSTLFAQQNKNKKSSSLFKALTHGFFAFVKSYVIKQGFLGGYEGFVISAYNAHTAYYKYLKLYEINASDKNR